MLVELEQLPPFTLARRLLRMIANYNGNYTYGSGLKGEYRQQTTEVGKFSPNTFGLYDMHGNIWEWCQDGWHDSYIGAPTDGTAWMIDNDNGYRLLRGGSWYNNPRCCRSAFRNRKSRDYGNDNVGFRVVVARLRTS